MRLFLDEMDFHCVNSVGGELYLSIGDAFFPEDKWYDMAAVDFENWLPALLSFAQGHTDSCVLCFMDGPYKAKLIRHVSGTVTVTCLRDSVVTIPQTEINLSDFFEKYHEMCPKI